MTQSLNNWRTRRRLMRILKGANRIIYTEKYKELSDIANELAVQNPSASYVEICVVIESVAKIEEELQRLMLFEYPVQDKDVVRKAIDECLDVLDEIRESDGETKDTRMQLAEAKAERALSTLLMSFIMCGISGEETLVGAVYKGCKLKQGPLTIEERKTFRRLITELESANQKLEELDDELQEMGYEPPPK